MPSIPAPSTSPNTAIAVTSAFGPYPVGTILTGVDAEAVLASEHALQVVRITLPASPSKPAVPNKKEA